MFRLKEYIQNANILQKIFLFTGVIAFAYWFVEVDLLWALTDFPDNIYLLSYRDEKRALWVIFISIVGSYVFQTKKRL